MLLIKSLNILVECTNLTSFLALKSPGSKVRPNISYSLFEELVSWCAHERRSWRWPCELVRVAFSKTCIVFTARLNLTSGCNENETKNYLTNQKLKNNFYNSVVLQFVHQFCTTICTTVSYYNLYKVECYSLYKSRTIVCTQSRTKVGTTVMCWKRSFTNYIFYMNCPSTNTIPSLFTSTTFLGVKSGSGISITCITTVSIVFSFFLLNRRFLKASFTVCFSFALSYIHCKFAGI